MSALDAVQADSGLIGAFRSIGPGRGPAVLGVLLSLGLLVAGPPGWFDPSGEAAAPPAPRLIIDPNSAPAEVLTALPGLGPGLAGRWIAARAERPFRSMDDLERRVRGVGPATLGRIAPFLKFPEAAPD